MDSHGAWDSWQHHWLRKWIQCCCETVFGPLARNPFHRSSAVYLAAQNLVPDLCTCDYYCPFNLIDIMSDPIVSVVLWSTSSGRVRVNLMIQERDSPDDRVSVFRQVAVMVHNRHNKSSTKVYETDLVDSNQSPGENIVYTLWYDGEITHEKGGKAFGQRNPFTHVHPLRFGRPADQLLPYERYGKLCLICTEDEALYLRSLLQWTTAVSYGWCQ